MNSETFRQRPVREVKPNLLLKLLVHLLSNEYLLKAKTLNYSWNARNGHLKDVQGICHDLSRELDRILEETAELIQKLNGAVPGSLSEVLAGATLSDSPGCSVSARKSAAELATDHKKMISEIESLRRQALGEQHSLSALTRDWCQRHSRMAATLEAIAQNRLHLH